MKTPEIIKSLARERLSEAAVLCENGKYNGAFYIAGYAVELMLKAKICERFRIPNLFDEEDSAPGIGDVRRAIKTHNINSLLIFCGLKKELIDFCQEKMEMWVTFSNFLLKWSENCRYLPNGYVEEKDVINLIYHLSNEKGILQWIDKQ